MDFVPSMRGVPPPPNAALDDGEMTDPLAVTTGTGPKESVRILP